MPLWFSAVKRVSSSIAGSHLVPNSVGFIQLSLQYISDFALLAKDRARFRLSGGRCLDAAYRKVLLVDDFDGGKRPRVHVSYCHFFDKDSSVVALGRHCPQRFRDIGDNHEYFDRSHRVCAEGGYRCCNWRYVHGRCAPR